MILSETPRIISLLIFIEIVASKIIISTNILYTNLF